MYGAIGFVRGPLNEMEGLCKGEMAGYIYVYMCTYNTYTEGCKAIGFRGNNQETGGRPQKQQIPLHTRE